MNKVTIGLIFGIAGLALGAIGSTFAWLKFVEMGERNRTLTRADLQLKTLHNLRRQDVQTVYKIQERMLNASILSLEELITENPDEQEARVLLQRILKYREQHPTIDQPWESSAEVRRILNSQQSG